jgi:hypothetical protein
MKCDGCDATLPAEARFCLSCGARVQPAAPDATVDPLLEALRNAIGFQYRIERLLGRGGMGAVYLAHELALDRDVAIKVLPPEHAGTPQVRERFQREARTAARLSHPHIVPLHTFGEVSGLLYFVMGHVAGESLAARLRRGGPLDTEAARAILVSMCDALAYAHAKGIVHRDIKPDNILIDAASGAPMLTDFGIAKAMLGDAQLTAAGHLIGTPDYMSPEQASGRPDVGPRSDLYSLGVVAYEMLSGRRPFEAATPLEALTARLGKDPKPLGSVAAGVAPDLASALDRCLQRDPANRWADAKSLREALMPSVEETEDGVEVRLLRGGIAGVALGLLGSGHLAIFAALDPGVRLIRSLQGAVIGTAGATAMLSLVGAIWLRSQGFGTSEIARKALQQPRWWRSWYPRSLRRPGDVWDRLPRPLRRFRVCLGISQIFGPGIFAPLYMGLTFTRQLPGVRLSLVLTLLALVTLMFLLRHRATRYVGAAAGLGAAEASRVVSTPTWRASVWRRAPVASLLRGRPATPSPVEAETQPEVTRARM